MMDITIIIEWKESTGSDRAGYGTVRFCERTWLLQCKAGM